MNLSVIHHVAIIVSDYETAKDFYVKKLFSYHYNATVGKTEAGEKDMSKINPDECSSMDMEWYAVDREGNIAVFCSGGEGNLPEFVCENVERADELIEYFNGIENITNSILLFPKTERAERTAR